MLIPTITHYLLAHKRLVVPQLGTFIVKEPERSVLFSELLRRDDGVLRQLLRDGGMGELEAAGEIDRFVFEIRHAVQNGGEYRIEGFGVMHPGPNDTIAFRYEPAPETPCGQSADPSAAASQRPEMSQASRASEDASPAGDPAPDDRAALRTDRVAEAVRTAFDEPRVSPSVKMNPDPSVRGLRYGKPPRTTDAYRYVDRAPRRRADRFIWIAVIAAAIAVAAIAFGYFREAHDRAVEAEYIELTAPQDAPAAPTDSEPATTDHP